MREVPVQVFGALREMMHEGRLEGRVNLATVVTGGVHGVGALSELRGEVTIVDGEAWLSYPEGKTDVRTVVTRTPAEAAALLVISKVEAWEPVAVDREMPLASLEGYIAEVAGARGIDIEKPFPLRIEGPVRSLDWHVIDGSRLSPEAAKMGHEAHLKSAVRGRMENTPALLVGFYSAHHHGVFTHHDSNVHLHMVDRSNERSGHVDDVVVAPGATLKLPLR